MHLTQWAHNRMQLTFTEELAWGCRPLIPSLKGRGCQICRLEASLVDTMSSRSAKMHSQTLLKRRPNLEKENSGMGMWLPFLFSQGNHLLPESTVLRVTQTWVCGTLSFHSRGPESGALYKAQESVLGYFLGKARGRHLQFPQ